MGYFNNYDTEQAFDWLLESDLITHAFIEKDWEAFRDKVVELLPHNSDIDDLCLSWREIFEEVESYKMFCWENPGFTDAYDISHWYRWKKGDFGHDCA
ncbi:MAG TPA: hypothetical protein VFG24_00115 [Nitrosopumilaceae archaeon]|nr:hypothetical protein [Nitrosopumilaceae archaeon]